MVEEIWLQEVMVPLNHIPSKRGCALIQMCNFENMKHIEENRYSKEYKVEILKEIRCRALIMQCLMV
jgi:hypothetical protein